MNSSSDDLRLAISNKAEGIRDYLNNLGKLYVTPYGSFTSLAGIVNIVGGYHKSALRRLKSKQAKFQNWYIIDGDTDLYPAEECDYSDEVDDILFNEGCWLSHIDNHVYGTPLAGDSVITYLYKGVTFQVTYLEFISGYRPHQGKVI